MGNEEKQKIKETTNELINLLRFECDDIDFLDEVISRVVNGEPFYYEDDDVDEVDNE